mgnify:CR=1 FL=1
MLTFVFLECKSTCLPVELSIILKYRATGLFCLALPSESRLSSSVGFLFTRDTKSLNFSIKLSSAHGKAVYKNNEITNTDEEMEKSSSVF